MFIDEFVNHSDHRYVIVFYDEDVSGRRQSFAMLYDTLEEEYKVSLLGTGRVLGSSAYGWTPHNIESNLIAVKNKTDLENLIKESNFDSERGHLQMFASFCDGEKSLKEAFNKLRDPLESMMDHLKSVYDQAETSEDTSRGPLVKVNRTYTTKEKSISLGPLKISYSQKPTYKTAHMNMSFLPRVVGVRRKATATRRDITIHNGKNLVMTFSDANILYYMNSLRVQKNARKPINRFKNLFKGK